jgi:hypothetical protein
MSDIKFNCPYCNRHLLVDEAGKGRALQCPDCNQPIVVPIPAAEATNVPPAQPPLTQTPAPMPSASAELPGKLTAIAILQLVTGIIGLLIDVGFFLLSFGLYLFLLIPCFTIVVYILAIISGAKGLGANKRHGMYRTVGILQLFCILGCDVLSLVSGILTLIFLSDPKVKAYLEGRS